MFNDVGNKIKNVAQIVCWLGIIASVIGGFCLIATDEDLAIAGILVMAIGSLISWLTTLTLYGFGQLIENSDILVEQNNQGKNKIQQPQVEKKAVPTASTPEASVVDKTSYVNVTCPNCKTEFSVPVGETIATCPHCNVNLKISY